MPGATPTATAALNKSAYSVGETMILTVDHQDADRQVLTVSVVVTDGNGNVSPPATATATIDAGVVTFTQTGGRTWALQPGSTLTRSVFTAIA